MDKVRIGIIGIGNMGSSHATYISRGEIPNAELKAVCDINPDRLKWAGENIGEEVQKFDNPEALITSGVVDAVMIATPHYEHPPLAIKALSRTFMFLLKSLPVYIPNKYGK
jgi:Oxidoreductase family, NAD-binding Rossmann fold.